MRRCGDHEPRDAGDEKRGAPSQHLPEPPADQEAEQDTETAPAKTPPSRCCDGRPDKDRKSPNATAGWSRPRRLRPRRVRRRAASSSSPPARRGHEAEDHQGRGDDARPIEAIGDPCERNAEAGVQHRERESVQKSELGIGKCEIAPDRLGHTATICRSMKLSANTTPGSRASGRAWRRVRWTRAPKPRGPQATTPPVGALADSRMTMSRWMASRRPDLSPLDRSALVRGAAGAGNSPGQSQALFAHPRAHAPQSPVRHGTHFALGQIRPENSRPCLASG